MNLLAVGKKRLVFAETKMNRTSSRSHSVCMLLIERTLSKEEGSKPKDCVPNEKKTASSSIPEGPSETEEVEEQDSLAKMTFTDDVLVRGRIHLCDLAGSERLKKTHAEGERLSEAQHINLSLLELGNVIHALADGTKTHVPFRNSTLTRLLQESLGGNCKTSLIVCVSPTMSDVSETKSTLNFGSRAMKITNTAYVNVEVDYKKLSDDLTKMLNSREKDMEDLKESYESRIEKVKMEAESQISSSMVAAQEALSSVRSLFESKEQELKNEMQQVDEELQREKHLSSELREQLSSLGGCISGGVNRAKTALLAELLSMQLFYTIQGLPDEQRQQLASEMQGEYLYSGEKLLGVREKVLENTDNVLQLLQSYLKLDSQYGEKLEKSGLNLRDLEMALLNGEKLDIGSSYESNGLNSEHQELSWNKTDDDKVIESQISRDDDDQQSNQTKFFQLTKSLRDKLIDIKCALDGDAIGFLKKAFALDDCISVDDRKKVYDRMVEFLQQRERFEDKAHDNSSVSMLKTEMAFLDQSLCHVLVDKALQSSLLLLEQSEVQRHCNKLSENNKDLNKELEVMRLQVETLVSENSKLNSKLSETSNFLQDVKSSKEMLENDLSSVFQLYNMRSPELKLNKTTGSDIKDGISTLVEENAKLKVELKDTQEEKRDLQLQLKNAKEKFEKLEKVMEMKNSNSSSSKSTQTTRVPSPIDKSTKNDDKKGLIDDHHKDSCQETVALSNGQTNSPNDNDNDDASRKKSVSKKLVDIEQFLVNLQDELVKLEDDESALFSHSNQRQMVSSLRLNLNKRLGELWSIEVVESKKLRARIDELTIKLESAAYDYEKQIEDLESELHNESQSRLNLENELLQYRKEVMDLGAEIWTLTRLKEPETAGDMAPDVQRDASTPLDEMDSRRRLSSGSLSLSRCNSDDSLHEFSRRKADLRLAEIDAKRAKEELNDLKQSFTQLNQNLADSGKVKQEMEERFVNLSNENKTITLKFKAAEEKNKALEEKIVHVSALKTTVQEELLKLKKTEHSHLEDIRGYKEKIASYEVEKTRLKQELSKTEIKFTTMDNKYKEVNDDLLETKKRLKESQARLKSKEQELRDLHDAYDRLRDRIVPDDSDRESLVEVKMKQNGRRDSATPSRIQSIHLVSRAKSPKLKKQPSYLAAKKKMSIKRSPRSDEISARKNTLKRGTLGQRGTLTTSHESRTLTRGDSERDTMKRAKGRPIKGDNEEDQKLKSELLLAKEQLLRLKGELTLSNIQTANLGTHLTSLREDSNKLEVELSSLRRPPASKAEDSCKVSADKHMDAELENAQEKIIGLQDDILALRREKETEEEKVAKSEEEAKQLRSELYKTRDGLERSQEVVKILNKEIELLETKNQILQHRLTSYTNDESEKLLKKTKEETPNGESSLSHEKLAQYERDKVRLEKEIEQLSSEKTKLQDMQNLVQQLVEIEDEQALLKLRLRKAVKQATKNDEIEEKKTNSNGKDSPPGTRTSQKMENKNPKNTEKKLEEYYVENTALRCEVDALRIYISNLENENKTVKYKLSISESMHANSDKKVLATLLASAKHEREELRETLNGVYSEKEDMEEALNVSRIKSERLQRELLQVLQSRSELEKEVNSLKNDAAQVPEKEKPSTSLTMEEKSVVDLVRKFLSTVGSRNVKEKEIKDFARTLLARKIHLNGRNAKQTSTEHKQPWNRSSSITRNAMKRDSSVNSSKAQVTVNRNTNTTPTKNTESCKANSTSGLRRLKPGTDRGTPEGMEEQRQTTSNKSKCDLKIINSATKMDDLQSLKSISKEVKDDLSLIYLDIDAKDNPTGDGEVLIKRAWSLKDLFKRNAGTGKALTNPSVINQ
ncbi:Kinesin heavy chain isoform 5C [Exaiptasia diaphana]|nr:Kinesin heavy chain isoform 5C [Exaiptasia diaphana]